MDSLNNPSTCSWYRAASSVEERGITSRFFMSTALRVLPDSISRKG